MTLAVVDRRVRERTTAIYTATLKDESGVVVPAASLDTLTLTLYDKESGDVINSRSAQNVLNANDVTVDSTGLLTWILQPLDNVIVDSTLGPDQYELHVALFEWTWNAGTKAGKHEVLIEVQQLTKVPAA